MIRENKRGKKMKPILQCNRCDYVFRSDKEQEVEFYSEVARSRLELCPMCGMFDSHYIFERSQIEELQKEKK